MAARTCNDRQRYGNIGRQFFAPEAIWFSRLPAAGCLHAVKWAEE
jgi:hypothetical protein